MSREQNSDVQADIPAHSWVATASVAFETRIAQLVGGSYGFWTIFSLICLSAGVLLLVVVLKA